MVKKTIEIEAKSDGAVKEIEKLQKQVEELNKEVSDSNKKTEKSLDGVEKASKSTASGIRAIGTTLKAVGIGLLLQALGILQDLFNSNQKAVDFFNTSFEVLSILFNDFVNFITRNVGVVSGAFKSIFDDPVQSIKNFGNLIKENILERFNSLIESAGLLASAIGKLFSGDFAGAMEDAKKSAVEFVDVYTGVDNSLEKGTKLIVEANKSILEYGNNVRKTAMATTELKKQSELLQVVNQGLIENYDIQAEKLRQVRDDDRLTIEERIKANDKLKKVLEEQQRVLIANANKTIQLAEIELSKDKSNQQARIQLQEALNEKKAIEAQVTGFLSEQKVNEASLERELLDLKQSDIDATNERILANKQFQAEQIQNDVERLQSLLDLAQQERIIEEERLTNKRDLYKQGTQAYVDANNELLNFQQDNNNKQLDLTRKLEESKKAVMQDALGNVAGILGQSSSFGKGIAIAQAIRDTYAGANKAFAQGGIFGKISALAIIASGLKNVQQIASTNDPALPSFATGGGSGGNVGNVSTPPAFNVVGASAESQLAQTIAGQTNEPVRAYVVSNDVTTAQEMDRNIVRGASL